MKIPTKGADGQPNGYVILGWNALEEPGERPDQVYVTAIKPGCHKGPHLHKIRCGRFLCIKGNVRIVTRSPALPHFFYEAQYSGEDHGYARIKVEPGVAACIYNDGPETALVINMPSPAWAPDQQDEWPVGEWIG